MQEALLLAELKNIAEESKNRGIQILVIGAFCVKAYDCLVRESYDLDLGINSEAFEPLAALLTELGYSVRPRNIWVTAEKQIGEEQIAIHIAVDEILDLNSQSRYPLRDEEAVLRRYAWQNLEVPALSLSGLLITKLIAFRENDVVDVVAILMERFNDLNSAEFYEKSSRSQNLSAVHRRLIDLLDLFESDEIDGIWFVRLRQILSNEAKAGVIEKIKKLIALF